MTEKCFSRWNYVHYYSFEVAANSGHTAAMLHSMRQFLCLADSLITITLWQDHVFLVIAVAADGLVLGARTFADTVLGKFRSCTRSWIIPQRLAGDVSVTCAIIGLWLMITHMTFQYGEFFRFYDTHVRIHVCVWVCVCVCVSQARINHSVNKC